MTRIGFLISCSQGTFFLPVRPLAGKDGHEVTQDHRRHKRFMIEGMEIGGRMMFASDIRIMNISISGVSLVADRRLELGTDYTLKLSAPGRSLAVRGTVVWAEIIGSRKNSNDDQVPIYSAGLRFSGPMDAAFHEIIRYIEQNRIEKDPRLTGIRFHIVDSARAMLSFPESFSVKKISRGGMLIESIHEIEIGGVYPMEIAFPEMSAVRVSGRVASCLREGEDSPPHFDVGVEFLDMSDDDRARLGEFIGGLESGEKKAG